MVKPVNELGLFGKGDLMMVPGGWSKKCSKCGKWSMWWEPQTPPKDWPGKECRGCHGGPEEIDA